MEEIGVLSDVVRMHDSGKDKQACIRLDLSSGLALIDYIPFYLSVYKLVCPMLRCMG